VAELGGLAFLGGRAPWREVERVLEARFEWERLPLDSLAGGAVHVGVMDALAGLPFRVVAIPGLVEGGYPGVLRPDPFPPRRRAARPGRVRARGRTGRPPAGRAHAARTRATPALALRRRPSASPAGGGGRRRRTRRPAHGPGPPARGAACVPALHRPGHGAAHPLLPARGRTDGTGAHAVAVLRGRGRRPRRALAGRGRPRPASSARTRSTTRPSTSRSTAPSATAGACVPAAAKRRWPSPPAPPSSSSRT
jgi:hypothetical protein